MPNSNLQFGNVTGNVSVIQTGGDIHGDIIAGDKTVTQKIINVFRGDKAQIARRNRRIMLEQVRQNWIEGVLEKSIHQAILLKLDKQAQPGAVDYPWERQLQETTAQTAQPIPQAKPIIEIFEEQGRALLILGAPGSGKTITLLELTRDALHRAEGDPTLPVPVVFNLSSWAERRLKLADWLIEELNLKYQISKKVGAQWLAREKLLLLLDGLDEVHEKFRAECVHAINAFRQEHGLTKIVVCSRLEEYQRLSTQLKLNAALVLQPLTLAQIDEYLSRGGDTLAALRAALTDDPTLQELAASPLMLSMMTLTYRNQPIEKGLTPETPTAKRQKLLALYTQRMLQRHYSERVLKWRMAEDLYTGQQVRSWLAWLARRMAQHSQSEFFLEGLQPTWLSTRAQRAVYAVGVRACVGGGIVLLTLLAIGLFYGLAAVEAWSLGGTHTGLTTIMNEPFGYHLPIGRFSLFALIVGAAFELASVGVLKLPKWLTLFGTVGCVGLLISLLNWIDSGEQINWVRGIATGLLFGLPGGWLGASISPDGRIKIAETLTWSWRQAFRGACLGLIGEVGLTLMFQFILRHNASFAEVNLLDILEAGILLVLACIIGFGVRGDELPDCRMAPGHGLRRSARNAIQIALISLDATLLCFVLTIQTSQRLLLGVTLGIVMGLLIGMVLGLAAGGLACIQHGILRFILIRNGDLPRHVVTFLEYATERILLRKVGGGYIFTHRLLLEYFANLKESQINEGGK